MASDLCGSSEIAFKSRLPSELPLKQLIKRLCMIELELLEASSATFQRYAGSLLKKVRDPRIFRLLEVCEEKVFERFVKNFLQAEM